jgi:hypothetical protein
MRLMQVELRLSEVMAALSHALDISDGHPAGHATRTCLIGMRIADELDLRICPEAFAALEQSAGTLDRAA